MLIDKRPKRGGGCALRVKIPRDRLTTALTFMALHIQPSNLSHLMSVPGSYTVKMETEMVTNERKEEEKFGRLEKKEDLGCATFLSFLFDPPLASRSLFPHSFWITIRLKLVKSSHELT